MADLTDPELERLLGFFSFSDPAGFEPEPGERACTGCEQKTSVAGFLGRIGECLCGECTSRQRCREHLISIKRRYPIFCGMMENAPKRSEARQALQRFANALEGVEESIRGLCSKEGGWPRMLLVGGVYPYLRAKSQEPDPRVEGLRSVLLSEDRGRFVGPREILDAMAGLSGKNSEEDRSDPRLQMEDLDHDVLRSLRALSARLDMWQQLAESAAEGLEPRGRGNVASKFVESAADWIVHEAVSLMKTFDNGLLHPEAHEGRDFAIGLHAWVSDDESSDATTHDAWFRAIRTVERQ